MNKEYWYRIQETLVSGGVDEYDNPLGLGRVIVSLQEFELLSRTTKGVWLDVYRQKRFVLVNA